MSFDIVKGDLGPFMPVTITVDGVAIDTSTADTVELKWAKPDGTLVTSTLTPVNPAVGAYNMVWDSGNTDQIGPHLGQVVVTEAGVPKTYPSDGSYVIWFVNPTVADC